ncbi:hypothetical protein Hamer_G025299 [Homarus americanus]|uniref:Uncharacterized protein n=1 Tax=Homarus americanus TaxID=6706 RepID=A0A8J5MQ73_HOMAM|nr:hypothetical protein Hamer_G025299 [Homarus americanus]
MHKELVSLSNIVADVSGVKTVDVVRDWITTDRPKQAVQSEVNLKLKPAKNDCLLFSGLYIGCQNRGGSFDDFFAYENQAYPPSISDCGRLRTSSKSDLLQCFEKLCEARIGEPDVSAVVIDGAAVVQMLKSGTTKTFKEYSKAVFYPYIARWLGKVKRVDVRRGTGTIRRVMSLRPLSRNWPEFLRVDENKIELFNFLSQYIIQLNRGDKMDRMFCVCKIVWTYLRLHRVLMKKSRHCIDAASKGHNITLVRAVDTDVVVLPITNYHRLAVKELWMAFGSGNNFRYLPVHLYASAMGQEKARALPMFQAIT